MSDPRLNFRMLRLARELRGVTQTELGRSAGIPQARLSRIESGQIPATAADITAIATTLELPRAFLGEPGVPAAVPLFRKRAIRSVKRLTTIQARLNTAVLIAQRLLDAGIDLDPPQTFPDPGSSPRTSRSTPRASCAAPGGCRSAASTTSPR